MVSKTIAEGSIPSSYAKYAMAIQYEDAKDNNVPPQLTLAMRVIVGWVIDYY